MPIARVQLPDGRIARFEVAEGTPPSAIEAAASQLLQQSQPQGIDPNTGRFDPGLSAVDELMAATSGGAIAPPEPGLRAQLSSIPLEESLPLVGATLGSIAFPPLGATRAASIVPSVSRLISPVARMTGPDAALPIVGRLAQAVGRRAASVAPPIAGAALGGGAGGGAAEAMSPGATPESISQAALETGGRMAAAEGLGLGVAGVAGKLYAPNLRFLDPLKPVRERVASVTKSAVSGGRDMLARVLERATVNQGGRQIVDVNRFQALWREIPESTRNAMSETTRRAADRIIATGKAAKRAGRFVTSPVGGELLEAAVVPVATAIGGLGVGIPLMLARAMLMPGPLTRYLTRSQLPGELTRTAGRQAVTTPFRVEEATAQE